MGITTSCIKFPKKLSNKIECIPAEYTPNEINLIQKQWSVAMRNCDTVGYTLFEK